MIGSLLDTGEKASVLRRRPPNRTTILLCSPPHLHQTLALSFFTESENYISICETEFIFQFLQNAFQAVWCSIAYSICSFRKLSRNKRRSDSSPSCLRKGSDQRRWALLSVWEHTHFDPLLPDLHSTLWFHTKAFVLVLSLQTDAFKERCSSATFLKYLF